MHVGLYLCIIIFCYRYLGGVRNYFSLKVETLNAPVNVGLMRSSAVGGRLFTRNTDAYCLNNLMWG